MAWPGKTISLVTHYIVGDVKQRGRYLWVSGSEGGWWWDGANGHTLS